MSDRVLPLMYLYRCHEHGPLFRLGSALTYCPQCWRSLNKGNLQDFGRFAPALENYRAERKRQAAKANYYKNKEKAK